MMKPQVESSQGELPPIICLMGPTASGKTPLAIEIVKHFPCEIISVDSRMVYRGMNIGTAKPDASTLKIAPHRLIDLLDPKKSYSAGLFREDAMRAINEIIANGNVPLLVGGTMLYFHVLQRGLAKLPTVNIALRTQLKREAHEKGLHVLHKHLAEVDPVASHRIHPNDSQRILRALEIYIATNKTMTSWLSEGTVPLSSYRVNKLVLAPQSREQLHERIANRLNEMLENGFINEVAKLRRRGDLSREMVAFRSVGYQEVWDHLEGKLDYQTMCEKIIIATRQLAKRQFTWLTCEVDAMRTSNGPHGRNDEVLRWVDGIVKDAKREKSQSM
jgi:tRNA dimethylallyltransferase